MLKYKRITTPTLTAGQETLVDMLGGMAGKNRHIISISTKPTAGNYLRVYRDADQIVDCDSERLTTAAPFLLMDLPLTEGQHCKTGIYCTTTTTAVEITIGYTEAD